MVPPVLRAGAPAAANRGDTLPHLHGEVVEGVGLAVRAERFVPLVGPAVEKRVGWEVEVRT